MCLFCALGSGFEQSNARLRWSLARCGLDRIDTLCCASGTTVTNPSSPTNPKILNSLTFTTPQSASLTAPLTQGSLSAAEKSNCLQDAGFRLWIVSNLGCNSLSRVSLFVVDFFCIIAYTEFRAAGYPISTAFGRVFG